MGLLVEGVWQDVWYDTKSTNGEFIRKESQFRDNITKDGSNGFKAEVGRYHLYVSLACPWASRTLIFRKLKKLESVIGLSVVSPFMFEKGWNFEEHDDCVKDTVNNAKFLYEIYLKANSNYSGRVTVPVLWDKKTNTIVNNESSEIIRMFNSEFDDITGSKDDYYPQSKKAEIESLNETIYENINNGVYRCGFATTQEAYEKAYNSLFNTLDDLEELLSKNRYLCGETLTEADWRFFVTLVRFDAVYVGHFKCNKKRIFDYHNIENYMRELYQIQGIKDTVNLTHIKNHYYQSQTTVNPTQIVPLGPTLYFDAPHDRGTQK